MKRILFLLLLTATLLPLTACSGHRHEFSDWTVEQEPSCTEAGRRRAVCACGEAKTEKIPALGHQTSDEWTVEREADCENGGLRYHVCLRCGAHVKEERTPALGHDWNAASCTEAKRCARCGATEGEPLGHQFENYICVRCGLRETCTLSFDTAGGSKIDPITVEKGKKVAAPERPTREGYSFSGWKLGGADWSFDTVLTEDLTLTATWTEGSAGLRFMSNGDGTCRVESAGSCTESTLVIPRYSPEGDRVTAVGDYAFHENGTIRVVRIPEGVETIGIQAFAGTKITTVELPYSLLSIGSRAFYGCSQLQTLKLPPKLGELGQWAFAGCSSLRELVLPDSLAFVPAYTFSDCKSLRTLTIPRSISGIGTKAFANCRSLTDIHYGGYTNNWKYLSLGMDWAAGAGDFTVHCLNGDYGAKPAEESKPPEAESGTTVLPDQT